MIEITFNPKEMRLDIKGHAYSDENGKDIVCAGVSTLFYTLSECLYEQMGKLEARPEFDDDATKDSHFIACKPKPEYLSTIQLMYWQTLTGLRCMADSYPEYIKFDN